ncbi:MAG: VWA domain-containing protein [Chloroflexota bacterium]
MNAAQDLYAILGVPPGAPIDDIRSAYRSAARRLHPDVNSHPGAATQFRDIAAAYDVLSDPIARDKYDLKRKSPSSERAYFTLRVTPSKRVLPILAEPQVIYVLVELVPERPRTAEKGDSNLNLTLVIDHSTSMNGLRLERTRAAAFQIIDQLTERDILSVVAFSDRAEVLVPANYITDKSAIKANIAIMQASGATEIFQGLDEGFKENRKHAAKRYVNHIILLTDGRTYGDEQACLDLAARAAVAGVGISAMGLGDEWNDAFLDQLASRTGGTSEYVSSPGAVVRFLNDRVRALGRSLAERVMVSLAPDPDIKIESAFRLSPSAQPVSINADPIPIGQLQTGRIASMIFQLQVPPSQKPGFRNLLRIDVTGDIMREQMPGYKAIADISLELSTHPPAEEPPLAILDGLGKLTLYRMQEKAEEALARGDVHEATRRLETLATRLLSAGHDGLASAAIAEARRVASTNMLSDEGHKALKYGTRLLIAAPSDSPPIDPAVSGESA